MFVQVQLSRFPLLSKIQAELSSITIHQMSQSVHDFLLLRIGSEPKTSTGWFRAGVGFYNKKQFGWSIECFEKAVEIDPMNVRLQILCVYIVWELTRHSITHIRSWRGRVSQSTVSSNLINRTGHLLIFANQKKMQQSQH